MRFALANAGEEIPIAPDRHGAGHRLRGDRTDASPQRGSAPSSRQRKAFFSRARSSIHSQIFAIEGVEGEPGDRATRLRRAYVDKIRARLAAIREISAARPTGRLMGVMPDLLCRGADVRRRGADDAAGLIALFTAGLTACSAGWIRWRADRLPGGSRGGRAAI